jgi:hypothetical protein
MADKDKNKDVTAEASVAAALGEKPYDVILGGKRFKFRPVSVRDREEMAAIASEIRYEIRDGATDGELLDAAIRYGKYGGHIARFIAAGAHVRGFPLLRHIRRRRIFRAAYGRATDSEIMSALNGIFNHIRPGFFLLFITSLNRQNILKGTKETEATVPG